MAVHPSFHAKSVAEFVVYAKSNPGKISYGSGGSGSGVHMASELFKMLAGIEMVHVPYRSESLALTDLLGERLQVVFHTTAVAMEHIKTGRLRALAVTTATRSELLPELPTVSESVPGYESSVFNGISAPKNTPAEIVYVLNKEINSGFADAKVKARFAELGGMAIGGSPTDFGKLIADETEKWAKVVKFAGIKAE